MRIAPRQLNRRLAPGALAARIPLVLALSLLLAAAQAPAGAADPAGKSAARSARPNIVLMMADDMGYECLSSNGSGTYRTPRLDALAAGGLRFTHCHSQPICTPSRVQLMTGIYNNRNYVRFGLLDPEVKTFAHALKAAGYATCIAGKWQLGGGLEGPGHFGFDEYCLWQVDRRPGRYVNPGLEVNGEYRDYTDGEFGPDLVSDYLCDFIGRHRDKPFLAYYPMILPHWPFEPVPGSPDYDPAASSKDKRTNPKYFKGMVEYTDHLVGKIVDRLEALGLRENTVVLFTGDNGTYTGITSQFDGRPYRGGKGKTSDNGTHVPFVASWPGTAPAGEVVDALVDFSDFFPTLAELAGADVPAGRRLDGISFAPILRGSARSRERGYIYCWYERNGRRGKAAQLTRDRRYKLYADGRFFDLEKDPAEKKPLAPAALDSETESGAQAAQARLQAALERHLAATAAADPQMEQRRTATAKKKAVPKGEKK